MKDLYSLAKGQSRRSSATVASSIRAIEQQASYLARSMDDEEMKLSIELLIMASALRWVLGDDFEYDSLTGLGGCFGEDSAGM